GGERLWLPLAEPEHRSGALRGNGGGRRCRDPGPTDRHLPRQPDLLRHGGTLDRGFEYRRGARLLLRLDFEDPRRWLRLGGLWERLDEHQRPRPQVPHGVPRAGRHLDRRLEWRTDYPRSVRSRLRVVASPALAPVPRGQHR